MDIRDLSCVTPNGVELHGAVAITYRIFRPENVYSSAEREADRQALRALVEKCGYARYDD